MNKTQLVTTAFLYVAIGTSAACALLESDKEPEKKDEPAPALTTPTDLTPHAGPSVHEKGLRCSRCHKDEERTESRWRDRARKIGHDISRDTAKGKTCTCCHLGVVEGFQDPIDEQCAECHDDIHVTIPAMGRAHCVSCHDFEKPEAERALREKAWECQRCHQDAQGNQKAIDVHGGTDCSGCHSPHTEPWVEPRNCLDCHPSEDVKHTEKPVLGAQACEDCHKPHEQAHDASGRCYACHSEKQGAQFEHATFKGHDACTTCHAPHEFNKESVRKCKDCHNNLPLMGVQGHGAAAHNDCESCHKPHDAKAVSANVCNSCHTKLHPTHPDPKGKGCLGCHDAHPATTTTSSLSACSTCHQTAHNDKDFHDGVACTRCHEPHEFTAKDAATCESCHKAIHEKATSKLGHAVCNQCHEKHRPLPVQKSCDSCHATESNSAPKGHQDCQRCHDPHDGSRGKTAACNNCHAEKAVSVHGKKGCNDCHRAHGPKGIESPPGCKTCHEPSTLPALHAKPSHQTCENCHSSHGPTKSDRKTCIGACHQKQMDHEPTARTCSGCHRFRTGR